jgi:hypothetical protein
MARRKTNVKCGNTVVIVTDDDEIEVYAEPPEGSGGDPEPPPDFGSLLISSSRVRLIAAVDTGLWESGSSLRERLLADSTGRSEADAMQGSEIEGVTVLFWAGD